MGKKSTKKGTKTGKVSAKPPPKLDDIEVWQLTDDPAGAWALFWQCIYPRVTPPLKPKRREFKKGKSFYFGAKGKKRRKISSGELSCGDIVVTDLSDPLGNLSHYVPARVLQPTGALYYLVRDDTAKPADKKERWVPLIDKAKLLTEAQLSHIRPPVDLAGKTAGKPDTQSDGSLDLAGSLVAVRPMADEEIKKDAKDRTRLPDVAALPFAYTFIRYGKSFEGMAVSESWQVVSQRRDESNPVFAEMKAGDLAKLIDTEELDAFLEDYERYVDAFSARAIELRNALQYYAEKGEQRIGKDGLRKVKEALDALADQTIPSALPGTTAPQGTLNSIAGYFKVPEQAGMADAEVPDWLSWLDTDASGGVVSSAETLGCLVGIVNDILDLTENWDHYDTTGVRAGKLLDCFDKFLKAGKGIVDLAAVAQAAAHGANTVPDQLSHTSPFAGAILGYLNAIRTSVKAGRTAVRTAKINALLARMKKHEGKNRAGKSGDFEARTLTLFIRSKMQRRYGRQWATVSAGALSGTSGIVAGLIATAAIANAWNPLGWTLFAIGLGVGVGVVTYSCIRHFSKKHRRKARRKRGHPETVEEFTNRALAITVGRDADPKYSGYGHDLLRIFHVDVRPIDGDTRYGYEVRARDKRKSGKADDVWESNSPHNHHPLTNETVQAIRDRVRRHVKA